MAGRDKCPGQGAGAGHWLFSWRIHRDSLKRTVLDAARPPVDHLHPSGRGVGGGGGVPLFCVEFCIFSLGHSKHILCMQNKIRKRACGKAGGRKAKKRGRTQSGKEKKTEAAVKEEDSGVVVGPPLTPALSQNKRPSLLTP